MNKYTSNMIYAIIVFFLWIIYGVYMKEQPINEINLLEERNKGHQIKDE